MSESNGEDREPRVDPQPGPPAPAVGQPSTPPPPPPPPPYGQMPPVPYPSQPPYPQSPSPQQYGQHPGYGQPFPQKAPGQGLYLAAAIINWVVLGLVVIVTLGIGIVAAAWFIPMTIRIHKDGPDGRKHIALGVCTLLFCNIISGILLLVADGDRTSA